MGKYYKRFLEKEIDLAPLGIERREDNCPYFCTPKGASIIGWAGVDGIHYCFIRGFGEMVFAVSPMETDYVRPLAADFRDFLRLLLACRDAGLLQQAWQWPEEKFYETLNSSVSDQAVSDTLDWIRDTMRLTPMEHPWTYLKNIQDHFDYSRIQYTEDFDDPDMNPNPPQEEWAVYFDGSIYGYSGRARAGREIPVKKEFQFAGRNWLVPAVYSCSQGLVVDFCMQADPGEYQRFFEKWSVREEERLTHREQMLAELENPLTFGFAPEITVNGKTIRQKRGSGICYVPGQGSEDRQIRQVLEHYHLDPDSAWSVTRACFPWKSGRRPEIQSLELTMVQEPVGVPGEVFEVTGPGDQVTLKMPEGLGEFLLTVTDYEPQVLDSEMISPDDMEYPVCYTMMAYTLSPTPEEGMDILDLSECDQPRPKQAESAAFHGCEAAAIAIIGGADGPTAMIVGAPQSEHEAAVCSAPHFEPAKHIQWYPVLHTTKYPPLKLSLI